jgi:1-acyl-sn-glycerol-3-phosphate acyltransferase
LIPHLVYNVLLLGKIPTMLYHIIRFFARISLHLYNKRIGWEGVENIPKNKPVLFAPTHCNSLLDGLFLVTALEQGIYCLARGDMFRTPKMNWFMRHLKLMPIFRQSENEENSAEKNAATFDECQELFLQNKWLLIFPEGISLNQKTVLPLKRGVTSMAQRAWSANIDLHIIPVSVTYDQFAKWGKKCDVVFGKAIQSTDIQQDAIPYPLNDKLHEELSLNVPSTFHFKGDNLLWGWFGQLIYYVGWVFHFPLYFLCFYWGKKLTKKNPVFHDSVITGLVGQLLPFYYLLLGLMYYWLIA